MAIQNPYDHALKILARTWPEHFLQLGFPGQPIHLLGTLSNVELALEIDRVDFLHEIELRGDRAYFHIDFQLEHEDDCKRRFFVYNGMLTELKKPLPVITLPVYLRPRMKELPDRYEVRVGGVLFHSFTYQPIKLWEFVPQIRNGELYIFAPLLPVLAQPPSEALLVEERELILNHEADSNRQRTLLTTAILIAAQSKLFASDFLWELFREDPMDLDNPVIAKLFDRAYGARLEAAKLEMLEEMTLKVAQANQRVLEAKAEVARREVEVKAARREVEVEAARREVEVEAARREAEVEAARREAEVEAAHREAEAETARQWQEMVFKILEHRFKSIPVALALLLQTLPARHRSPIVDLILDAPDAEQCLQAIQQFLNTKTAA